MLQGGEVEPESFDGERYAEASLEFPFDGPVVGLNAAEAALTTQPVEDYAPRVFESGIEHLEIVIPQA